MMTIHCHSRVVSIVPCMSHKGKSRRMEWCRVMAMSCGLGAKTGLRKGTANAGRNICPCDNMYMSLIIYYK